MKYLLFAIILSCLVAGISSDEASQKASTYLLDEPATALSSPMEVGVMSYWIFYNQLYSSSTTRLIVAINDESGQVVYEEEELTRIASAVYDYAVVEEHFKSQGYSFTQLSPALNSALLTLQKNQASLYDIESKTITAYPDISFEGVRVALDSLLERANDASIMASEGDAQQRIFESDYSSLSLNQLYNYYSLELDSLQSLFDEYDSFLTELNDLQTEVYSTVPDPDNKNVYEALDALRDIGLSELYSKFRSNNPRTNLEVFENRKEEWVEDAIASFVYRRNRIDSTQLYEVEYQRYAAIQSGKPALFECGLKQETNELESLWSDIEYYKTKDNDLGYAKMNELLPQATEKIDFIYAQQSECTAPQKRERSTVEDEDALTPLVYLIAFGMLGFAGYKYYQKKKLEQMMSE